MKHSIAHQYAALLVTIILSAQPGADEANVTSEVLELLKQEKTTFQILKAFNAEGIIRDVAHRPEQSSAAGLLKAAKGIIAQLRAEFGPHFETAELEAAIAKAENVRPDVRLSSGRTITHKRAENGSQDAIPTSGPSWLTPAESKEYEEIVAR